MCYNPGKAPSIPSPSLDSDGIMIRRRGLSREEVVGTSKYFTFQDYDTTLVTVG
jgi:hypothetical protein